MDFPVPGSGDMQTKDSWAGFFYPGLKNSATSSLKSSAGLYSKNYAATSTAVSDILQGSLNFRYPSEISNLVNIALTKQLNNLAGPGLLAQSYLAPYGGAGSGPPHDGGNGGGGGGGGGGDDGIPGLPPPDEPINTVEEMVNAGEVLLAHANFKLGSGSGGMEDFLLNGFEIDSRVTSDVTVKDGDIGYFSPNLLNLLYVLCENGFILGDCMGSAGFKYIEGTDTISQHSWGGATDIGSIGKSVDIGGDGQLYSIATQADRADQIFTEICEFIVSTVPQSIQPSEIGGPLDFDANSGVDYGISFYTNDNHEDHVHFGFKSDKGGILFSQLSGRPEYDDPDDPGDGEDGDDGEEGGEDDPGDENPDLGLNGYTINPAGDPREVNLSKDYNDWGGPAVDWSGIPHSGTIGMTHGGREINVYIRRPAVENGAKTIVIVGSIHGTENGGQCVAHELLFNKDVPDDIRIVAIPVMNGDAVAALSRQNGRGVDLNRNSDYEWGTLTGTDGDGYDETNPSSSRYKGPSAFSENETKAVSDFLINYPGISLFLIYHDAIDYVAPVGTGVYNTQTSRSYADQYAAVTGQNVGNDRGTWVTQRGSIDGWFNAQTGTPTLLVEMPPYQSREIILKHVDAVLAAAEVL